MQEHHLPVIGTVELLVLLVDQGFRHTFYEMDDKECRMRNVILRIAFGKKAGLIYYLAEQKVYYKDNFMIMSRLDEPFGPQGQNVNDVPTGVRRESQPTRK